MTDTTDWVEDHFIAGDVVLDFSNTVYRRRPELGADLLTDTEALTTWFTRASLLPTGAASATTVTRAVLDEARSLRAVLWAAFDAQRTGETIPPSALVGLLERCRRSAAEIEIRPDGSTRACDVEGALALLALRGIELLLDPPPQGIRACDRCGWFFIDSSRGRRRRWCSMKTCGNQAKVARYRSTVRPQGDPDVL